MPAQSDLMEQLAAPENLLSAWRAVRGNIPRYRRQRSAGPDGVTLADFEQDLPAQLKTLRHMLMHNRYQPQAPGLFTIAKHSGGTRQIALLNVADRVAQRAAQQVLEPLYEPKFLPCSFGFRPGRSIQDAVYCVRRMRAHGYAWVVDGDIAACFDNLNHPLLLQQINKRIDDPRVMDLLRKWLEIGILEHGLPAEKANWLEQGWQKAAGSLRQGSEWALNVFTRPDDPLDTPYAEPRYARYAPSAEFQSKGEDSFGPDTLPMDDAFFYRQMPEDNPHMRTLQQQAMQQLAAGGLMFGAKWARGALSKAGPAALAVLKSPSGRSLLKQTLVTGGGVFGAAIGVAVTAGIIYRQVAPAPAGVLQGSPLSPLLSNIYLNNFDITLTRAGYRLVRYADDWVILCPDQDSAETGYNQATIALSKIHLKINTSKTRILKPAEPLQWLGAVIE